MYSYFHGTSEANLTKIVENGLIPNGNKGADHWAKINLPELHQKLAAKNRLPSVYLTPYFNTARNYAILSSMVTGTRGVILKVKWDDNIIQDEADTQGIRVTNVIPSSNIIQVTWLD